VRQPQEKPHVEGRVRHLQRDWATPVPQVRDLAELNTRLRSCCVRDRECIQASQTKTIGQRFAAERAQALSLPGRPFDPCVFDTAKVDKYQMVRYDTNRYSVPREAALPNRDGQGKKTAKAFKYKAAFPLLPHRLTIGIAETLPCT
jgi:hypothetical protein